ncbi:MAG: hypothetical protein IPO99_20540 [Nitrospira sp.]|nr:hypothetical protein [Nitrospira sp.]
MQKHIERPVHLSKTMGPMSANRKSGPLSAREFMKLPVSGLMSAGKRLTFPVRAIGSGGSARIIHECSAAIADSRGCDEPVGGRLAARSVDSLFRMLSSRLRAPVSLGDSALSRRTVMKNAGE